MDNCVKIKSNGEEIFIVMHEDASMDEIKSSLREAMRNRRSFFSNGSISIVFKGRELSPRSVDALLAIMKEEISADITLAQEKQSAIPPPPVVQVQPLPAQELPAQEQHVQDQPLREQLLREERICVAPRTLARLGNDAMCFKGTLRAGQVVRYEGTVVILGDVKAGSEVFADGDIIVLGALHGMAHAGQKGDATCIVAAHILLPTQLRIARQIATVDKPAGGKPSKPACAYVKDGNILIGEL